MTHIFANEAHWRSLVVGRAKRCSYDSHLDDEQVRSDKLLKWGVSSVAAISRMFADARICSGDLSKWDTGRLARCLRYRRSLGGRRQFGLVP